MKLERVAVTLSRGERDALRELAVRRSEPEATTAARLVRAGLADAGARLDTPPKRRRGPSRPTTPGPAKGSEPRSAAWLPASACAIAVTQLSERYPLDLRDAVMPGASDRAAAERLAALSVWRDQLDAGAHHDPRVELMFSDELARTARWLEE
ncbi:MAG: hypothetical protein ABIV94_04050, partial [Acidimicrobiales bacterium]